MFKLKKIAALALAAVTAMSAMSVTAMADTTTISEIDENPNVKTMTKTAPDGGTVTITYDADCEVEVEFLDSSETQTSRAILSNNMQEGAGTISLDLDGTNQYRDVYSISKNGTLFSKYKYKYTGDTSEILVIITPTQDQYISYDLLRSSSLTGSASSMLSTDLEGTSSTVKLTLSSSSKLKTGYYYYSRVINTGSSTYSGKIDIN